MDNLREFIKDILMDTIFPTGKELKMTLYCSLGLTLLELILQAATLPHVLSVWSTLGATLVLIILFIIERSEYNEVSRLYGDFESRIKDIKSQYTTGSASAKDGNSNELSSKSTKHAVRRTDKRH